MSLIVATAKKCYHGDVTKTISILAVNAGSSSVKLGFFAVDSAGLQQICTVSVTGIGQTFGELRAHYKDSPSNVQRVEAVSHSKALSAAMDALVAYTDLPIDAIAQRVVYGGTRYTAPSLVDDTLLQELDRLTVFDPRHMPAALAAIRSLQQRFPDTPQVACFDTALFKDLPLVAQLTTLPRRYFTMGLRRYGFHGLSYEYLLGAFRDIAGEAVQGRVIIAHLGSGASITAFHKGQPIDTTMGFSPASGIPMSTRSGDIDPGVVAFLRTQGIDGEDFDRLVNEQSGLLGISELSADMQTLLAQESTHEYAADAVDVFCYQARKSIGSLVATLGGVDSLIFSGGIGEQAPLIRQRICEGLAYLGIDLDPGRNAEHADTISSATSKVGVHVLSTDESQILCRQAYQIVTNTENR